jgi:hypothetical protein
MAGFGIACQGVILRQWQLMPSAGAFDLISRNVLRFTAYITQTTSINLLIYFDYHSYSSWAWRQAVSHLPMAAGQR